LACGLGNENQLADEFLRMKGYSAEIVGELEQINN
jgi:hypothetical protein